MLALLFFDPIVVSNSLLFEPFIAQMLGFAVGIDEMPGALTWLGTCSCTGGLVCFYYASKRRIKGQTLQSDDFHPL